MFESEYLNAYHTRDVINSENHPRIRDEMKEEDEDVGARDIPSLLPLSQISENELEQRKEDTLFLKAIVKLERIDWKGKLSIECFSDQRRRKKRLTELEKLLSSLCESELIHVDGAFKRAATSQFKNLNEDSMLDDLFHGNKPMKVQAGVCVKRKRKTEREKLIESLTEIEKIHAEGAFKRKVIAPSMHNQYKVYIGVDKVSVTQLSDAT